MLALFGVHLSQYVKKGIKSNLHFTHLFPFHELIQRSSAAIPTQTKVTSNKSLSEKRLQNYDFALHVLFSVHLMSLVDSLRFQRTLCFLVSPHEQTSTVDSPVTSFALKRISSTRTGSSKNSGSKPMPNLALFPCSTKRHCLSPPMRSMFWHRFIPETLLAAMQCTFSTCTIRGRFTIAAVLQHTISFKFNCQRKFVVQPQVLVLSLLCKWNGLPTSTNYNKSNRKTIGCPRAKKHEKIMSCQKTCVNAQSCCNEQYS